jgi:MFS family permease
MTAPLSHPAAAVADGSTSLATPGERVGLYPWVVVGTLSIAHLVSFIDRFVMSLVLTPIKGQMHLSDTQLGAIQGLSFVLLYSVAGLPLGRLADTMDRRRLIAVGMLIWSAATTACAFCNDFGGLFAARIGVGFGEAALVPAAMSLIAGYFARERLGRAVSVFVMGSPLGKVVALIGGAWLLAQVIPRHGASLLGHSFMAWQLLFLCAALPGLLLVPVVLTLREPPRAAVALARPRFLDGLAHIKRFALAYALQAAAACMAIILVQAFGAWGPTFFGRVYHLTVSQTGYLVGGVTLIASPLGNLFGGWLTDLLQRRKIPAAPLIAIGLSLALAIPAALALAAAPNLPSAAIAFGALTFIMSTAAGPCLAGIQVLTPTQHRGTATALYMCVMTLVSVGLGPTLVGVISDTVFGAGAGIGKALIASTIGVALLGILAAVAGRRPFERAAAASPS